MDEIDAYLDNPSSSGLILNLLKIKKELGGDTDLHEILDDVIKKELLLIQEGTKKAYNEVFPKQNNIHEIKKGG